MENAVKSGHIPHASLICGEKGSGKKLLAGLYARAMLCSGGPDVPCGRCLSCRKALSGNHPDIIWVRHEKPALITVDEIREQLVNSAGIRPYESPRKVYIVPEADKMNVQAQNALLKTIEDPPPYAVILLLADNPDALLETVRSRCVRLDLRAVADREVRDYLIKECGLAEGEAGMIASYAQGNIGRAREAALDPDFRKRREELVGLMKNMQRLQAAELTAAIRSLAENKDKIGEFLDLMTLWFRDVLYYKAAKDPDSLAFRPEFAEIRREAAAVSYEGLEEILKAIGKAGSRLKANVNFDLTIELLLLAIRDRMG
ncbi:MAG: DNA polymerase III subunit delta' [Lachnospiraceae bacterium]|nr:DNA polymerase III subunit delta' [Lachnospiraceae bacterium]